MAKSHRTRRRNWSNLTTDLLMNIGKHLRTKIDVLRFRAVCTQFRSSVPLPPTIPSPCTSLKIRNPKFQTYFPESDHLLLTHSTVYTIEPIGKISSKGAGKTWVIKLEELKSGKLIFKDPMQSSAIYTNSSQFPTSFNSLDYKVNEIGKEYGLRYAGVEIRYTDVRFFSKVVVSKGLDEIDDGFAIMAVLSNGILGFWRYGDKHWTNMNTVIDENFMDFRDIVYHNGKFYALSTVGLVISMDPRSLKVTRMRMPLVKDDGIGDKPSYMNLVKLSKDLFAVSNRWFDCISDRIENFFPTYFNILKLDEENRDWVRVSHEMEDKMLFLGDVCSFSLSTREFSRCKRNSVYFSAGQWSGVVDLESATVEPLSFYPDIFWPSPTWLKKKKKYRSRG